MDVVVKRGYRTIQLCFKTYFTTTSLNQRVPTVTAADGHVGATSISTPTQAYVPGPLDLATAAQPFSDIPVYRGWSFLRRIAHMFKKTRRPGFNNSFHRLQLQMGPIFKMKGADRSCMVVVSGAEAVSTVMRAEGKYPSRGIHEDNVMWIYRKINKPYPMFFADGHDWKRIRSAGNKQILPQRVAKFVTPLSEIADDLMEQLEMCRDEDGNINDMREFITKWSLQGISYFVYGEKVDVYSDDPKFKEFMEVGVKSAQNIGAIISIPPLYRYHIPTRTYREFLRTVNKLQDVGKQILNRHYADIKEAIASGTVDDTKAVGLLDQWLIEGKYTEEEALILCCDMLAAGMDTTTNTAMFLLFELAKHPEIQERMHQEIRATVQDKKHPTWEDIQNMKLVRNSIKETLRLYVPIGLMSRILSEDAVLNGYQVPAGTKVMLNMMTTARDSRNFSHPELFDPDRWDKKTSEDVLAFTSLPFGFGPRMCYGRRLAELELYVLLSKIIPKFHLSTDVQELELTHKTVITTNKPVIIKMIERKTK